MTATTCSREPESTVLPVDEGGTTNHSMIAETRTRAPERHATIRGTQMNWQRIAVLGALSGTLVTLLARAATPVATPPAPSPEPMLSTDAASVYADVDRLRERLRPQTSGATPTRNLFAFGHAKAAVADPRSETAGIAIPTPVAPPPRLAWRMIGVAEDSGPDGAVFTAIVSGAGGVQLLKRGDVLDGHRVIAVRPQAVELSDGDRDPIVLTLE
jgi:hypothetical protein